MPAKNKGRDFVGLKEENTKWDCIILPHAKIDSFISAKKPDERYDVFYEDAEYKGLVASFQGKENTDITLSKGLIELTEFGKAFCKSCCED